MKLNSNYYSLFCFQANSSASFNWLYRSDLAGIIELLASIFHSNCRVVLIISRISRCLAFKIVCFVLFHDGGSYNNITH